MNKLINSLFAVAFVLLLSTSLFAQEKPEHKHSEKEMTKMAEHKCTSECGEHGCDFVKAKEMKAANSKMAEHVCTEECKTEGCDAVKAKECKSAKAKECKDKDGEAKTKECKDGAMYECPMKCEPASHKPGECSKCGMEMKKVSIKS